MASYRHLARIAVVQTLFAYEFRNEKIEPDLESNCREFSDKLTDLGFAHELLNGILANKIAIREMISREAPEWPFERIALADRVVLEMGIYEILHSPDVPPVVAINEAIEIAKVFGDLNSSKFINGVLSTVMNKYHSSGGQSSRKGRSAGSGAGKGKAPAKSKTPAKGKAPVEPKAKTTAPTKKSHA